jgi:dTDP-glucose 4,6-dehydratase
MRRFLVTGGAGFIGSNFIRRLLVSEPTATVVNLDLLTYAGVEATVGELDQLERHEFVRGDIRDPSLVDSLMGDADVVVNFAAESHVDRSIATPDVFLSTNVVGAGVLLEAAMRHEVPRFVHVSTDEVYGPIDEGAVAEDARLNPSSPYAASKAAADLLVAAYGRTHGYQAIITRCTNNYGPYQHPEKLIPLAITRLLQGGEVPLYGDGRQQRDWLWVEDHCDAIQLLIDAGTPGEIYNIGSGTRSSNLHTAETLRDLAGAGSIAHVSDRPGHDRRYAVDSSKLRGLGWAPTVTFEEGLARTVEWYRGRRDWWAPLVGTP